MITSLVIWVIGFCFTVSLCIEDTWKTGHLFKIIECAFLWPIVLGMWLRTQLKLEERGK